MSNRVFRVLCFVSCVLCFMLHAHVSRFVCEVHVVVAVVMVVVV